MSDDIVARLRLTPVLMRRDSLGQSVIDYEACKKYVNEEGVKLMREAADKIERLTKERDEARWEVCGFHHLTGFLAGDYAISRGWNYFNDERKWSEFPPSVKEFDEFLKAQSQLNIETIDRLREENRKLREEKTINGNTND